MSSPAQKKQNIHYTLCWFTVKEEQRLCYQMLGCSTASSLVKFVCYMHCQQQAAENKCKAVVLQGLKHHSQCIQQVCAQNGISKTQCCEHLVLLLLQLLQLLVLTSLLVRYIGWASWSA
jgi:hypothetical protein